MNRSKAIVTGPHWRYLRTVGALEGYQPAVARQKVIAAVKARARHFTESLRLARDGALARQREVEPTTAVSRDGTVRVKQEGHRIDAALLGWVEKRGRAWAALTPEGALVDSTPTRKAAVSVLWTNRPRTLDVLAGTAE
jgi:hypothetical protein